MQGRGGGGGRGPAGPLRGGPGDPSTLLRNAPPSTSGRGGGSYGSGSRSGSSGGVGEGGRDNVDGRRWAGGGGRGAGVRGRGLGDRVQGRGGGGGRGPPGPLRGGPGDPSKARDLPSLAALVEEGAAAWNVSRLCAAFNRAAKLSSPAVEHATAADAPQLTHLIHRILDTLAAAYLPLVPGLRDAKWCVIPLWACAKTGYWSGGLAATLLQRLGRDGGALMRQATDQGHSNVWWSVSEAPEGALTAGQTKEVLRASVEGLLLMGGSSIGTQVCSNVLLACARLAYADPALLHHLTSCLAAQPDTADCQHLANSLYALGELHADCGHTPRPQDLQPLAGEVVRRLPCGPRRVGSLGQQGGGGMFIPQALSNMLLGCSKLGYADPDLLQPLATAAGQAAARMDELHLATSLYALAVLGCAGAAYAPAVQCLTVEVQQRLQRQPDAFEPQVLSSMLYALAVLGCKGPPYAPAVYRLTVEVQQRLQRQPDAFEPQALSNMLYALAVLGCKGPAFALAVQRLTVEVQQRLQRQPDAFKPQDLSNVLYALAELGFKDPAYAPVVALAAECERRGFAGFSGQDVSTSAQALAKMGYSDQAWFESAVAAAVRLGVAEVFAPQAVSSLWHALVLAHHRPAAAFLESTAAASELLRTRASGQSCANLLWSLATLGVPYDPQLVGVLLGRLEELLPQVGEVNGQNLANSLWALAVMGPGRHLRSVEGLLREVARRWDGGEAGAVGGSGAPLFSALALVQLWQVQQELVHTEGCAELAGILAAGKSAGPQGSVLSAMRHAADKEGVKADQSGSELQRRVVSALGRLQQRLALEQGQEHPAGAPRIVSLSREQQVEGMVGRVDVVVELAGGRRVAVEVDGPMHFMANDPHTRYLNGATQLRDRQLEWLFGAGNVVSVPYWEWDRVRRDRGREEGYLLRLLGLEA
ncbi:hypothetical protein TSOC_012847 [Tetrabaena socialis]|uniref:RAP domain-containing protein n=1 Tax=Tetrabaena socialis TaxID=47790 RepID=A0A2J7ZLX6_9CHLO|nr:hypothetical protein TSOC_012847 [Tetrabaena socialis]|eukprot:PNH01278.1 hypothetical protein TSOC_012847 [Tetrabaena socialis]